MQKLVFLSRENRFIKQDEPLLQVRKHKILLYIALQLFGVLASVAISQTIAAIGKLSCISTWNVIIIAT
jgi:hypothetical protein